MMSMVDYIRSRGGFHELSIAISRKFRREPAVKATWKTLQELQVEVMPNGEVYVVGPEGRESWAA